MVAQGNLPEEIHLGVSETKQQLSKLVNEVAAGNSRVVIEKHGLKTAVIIDMADYRQLLRHQARQRERDAAFLRISDAFADVPMDELERQIEIALADVRQKQREGFYDDEEAQ